MKLRILVILLIVAALTSMTATPNPLAASNSIEPLAQAATTPMLPGTTQAIKLAQGNQTNPSVACSVATYTNDDFEGNSSIHYVDFATNTDHVIPGNGLDRLSDTDGRRIAFTQIEADGDHIALYDLASQSTTLIPGNFNADPSIGGNLVAFWNATWSTPENWEIKVYEQDTGNVTQLTNDNLRDWLPAVSPDGKVVVWPNV